MHKRLSVLLIMFVLLSGLPGAAHGAQSAAPIPQPSPATPRPLGWPSSSVLRTEYVAPLAPASPAEAGKPVPPDTAPPSPSVAAALQAIPLAARAKIDALLLKQLLEAGGDGRMPGSAPAAPVTYLVYLRDQAAYDDDPRLSLMQQRQALVARLQATAARTQPGLRAYLEDRLQQHKIVRYQSFWVYNGFVVEGDLETAIALALRPEVATLRPNRIHHLPLPAPTVPAPALPARVLPEAEAARLAWGLQKIGADLVWQTFGVTGHGVVVANMDSGVDWTHPALQSKYRGYDAADPSASRHDYNWFDPTGTYPTAPGPRQPQPDANASHGTHTMGSIVGSTADTLTGVAPGARWVAVKVFDNQGVATDEWIHAGFQWCLAPTDLQGQNPDPSQAPDVLSNSWGADNGRDETFLPDVRALRAAGILTVFSAGNAGPGEGTVGSPGSFSGAFAVGAADRDDLVADFSSRGPSPWNKLKPEVVAPGVEILSSVPGGSFESDWSGTSMAAPHVAGLAALIQQAAGWDSGVSSLARPLLQRRLTITATEYLITSTAVDLNPFGPDNQSGYGRIDAYQAVASLIASGAFAGRVTNARTGQPVAGVEITVRDPASGRQNTAYTGNDGVYALNMAVGQYDVLATCFGYAPGRAVGIEILAHIATQLDLALEPLPTGMLRGRVTHLADGAPAAAALSLADTPVQTDTDAQGYYSFTLPAGTYTVRAMPTTQGYRGALATGVQVVAGAVVTQDLALPTAPRLLLVAAEAAAADSLIAYYTAALANRLFVFDTWAIRDTTRDKPSAADLGPYDLVIWSQPTSSPGYINAWPELAAYLEGGGRLLISGQNVGYWDGDTAYYAQYLHARFLRDSAGLGPVSGVRGDILEGLDLAMNTADSAANQTDPDDITLAASPAQAILANHAASVLGLRTDACAYRNLYLSFGLEGVGPTSAREQALERLIDWLWQARPSRAVSLATPAFSQAAWAGSSASYEVYVANEGQTAEAYALANDSSPWPVRLSDASTRQPLTRTAVLTPCASQSLAMQVDVPSSAMNGEAVTVTLRAQALESTSPGDALDLRVTALQPWTDAPALGVARYRLASAVLDCAIYAVGGYGGSSDAALDILEILDPGASAWRRGPPKPTPAGASAAAPLAGRLVVIGGYDPSRTPSYLDAVEVYDPRTQAWTSTAPLPQGLTGVAAAPFEGRIYVFGGSHAAGPSLASYVYDPATNAWTARAPAPVADLNYAQAVALGPYIYVAGGWPNRSQFCRYHPASNTWTLLSPLAVGRHSLALVASADGALYAAGGGDSWVGAMAMERYSPSEDRWQTLAPMQDAQHVGAGGAYVLGKFYVIGGTGASTTTRVEVADLDVPLAGSVFDVDQALAGWDATPLYSLRLRNPAPSAAQLTWRHVLPPELAYVAGSATPGVQVDPQGRILTWTGEVPAQDSLAFSFRARVARGTPDGTLITSTVALDTGACVARPLQARTQVSLPVLNARLSRKTVDQAEARPGEQLHYTIQVVNTSPYTLTDVALLDSLPAHTAYVTDSVQGAVYNPALQRLEWQGSLPPARSDAPVFDWVDATSGQALDLGDDSCVGPLDLGFEFEFYGRTYSTTYVNSNGMLLFDACSIAYRNVAIPSPLAPNSFVAPFWDDLAPKEGKVYLATFGEAPERYTVVEWHDVGFYGLADPRLTFEVILYEGTNRVVFQYLTLVGERAQGASATVGIENADGTAGVQYLLEGAPAEHLLGDRTVVELPQPSVLPYSRHHISYDVRIDDPLPPLTVIRNTAHLSDGIWGYERTVTTTVASPSFAQSTAVLTPDRVRAGDEVTCTLTLSNSGDVAAGDAVLLNPLPAQMAFVPGSLTGAGAVYDEDNRGIAWGGPLEPGEAARITYRTRVSAGLAANTWISMTATLYDRGVALAELRAGVLVNEINLTLSTKAAQPDDVAAGALLTYTIVARNTGLMAADSVALTDVLPSDVRWVDDTLVGAQYDPQTRTVFWRGALAPHGEHRVSFAVRTSASLATGSWITNTAQIDDGHGKISAPSAGVRTRRADLSGSDMVLLPARVAPGGALTCTLRLRNAGDLDTSAAAWCTPPDLFLLAPDSLYASSGQVRLEGRTIRWEGSINPGGMVLLRFGASAPMHGGAQVITTTATVRDGNGLETDLRGTVYLFDYQRFLPLVLKRID